MHSIRYVVPPVGFVYPTITVEQATSRGETAGSLLAVAKWNEWHAKGAAKFRRLRQAKELRAVATQLTGEERLAA